MDAATKEVTAETFCVDRFVEHVNQVFANFWKSCGYNGDFLPIIVAKIVNDEWIHLERQMMENDGKGGKEYRTNSVYGLIARKGKYTKAMGEIKEGGIYKYMSEKTYCGNIYDNVTYGCAGVYGLVG